MNTKLKPNMLIFNKEEQFKRYKKRRDEMFLNRIPSKKHFIDFTEQDRVEEFIRMHNLTDKYPIKELYRWHALLTSSCVNGRDLFVKKLGLNLETDEVTLPEFFEGVSKEHGGEIMMEIYEKMKKREEFVKQKKQFLIQGHKRLKQFKPKK